MKAHYLIAAALVAPAAIVALAPAEAKVAHSPFNQAQFEAAQRAGKPILIDVFAPWCPVCAAQNRAIDKITADPKYKDLVIFRIDYDTQRAIWQRFGAQRQSTLIAFRGSRETGRVAYDTNEARIAALLAGAVG